MTLRLGQTSPHPSPHPSIYRRIPAAGPGDCSQPAINEARYVGLTGNVK